MDENFPERLATREPAEPLMVARIDERQCIGCVLCLEACPFEAIAGAPKRMHTVLAALCTGCELCLPPCPVDCIAMVAAGRRWSTEDAAAARRRFDARRRPDGPPPTREGTPALAALPAFAGEDAEREFRRRAAAAAIERARARRLSRPDNGGSAR
jgi:electron transport complex protein RnfB